MRELEAPARVLTLVEDWSGTEEHPILRFRCELGITACIKLHRDEFEELTGSIECPPLVSVSPRDYTDLLGLTDEAAPALWTRASGGLIRLTLNANGDMMTVHGTNGAWLYRLHPATYLGHPGWRVGQWPD